MESNRIYGGYRSVAGALVGLGLMAATLPASALLIDINTYVTGSLVSGSASVGQLTLTQNGSHVDFSFSNSFNNLQGGIGDDAFISELLFSYNGPVSLTSASFSNFGGTQLVTANDFDINPSGNDAGYDFYIGLDFPTSSSARFTNGEVTSWTIRNVLLDDFLNPVTGSGTASVAMLHIQQVGAGLGGGKFSEIRCRRCRRASAGNSLQSDPGTRLPGAYDAGTTRVGRAAHEEKTPGKIMAG